MNVIGLMSGTSVDGIDSALVEISGGGEDIQVQFIAGATYPYPERLRSQILAVCEGAALTMAELADLDDAIAIQFAQAAIAIQVGYSQADLIGSHGQTVFHRPPSSQRLSGKTDEPSDRGTLQTAALGYSLQLGRGALIAHLTQRPTVSNFRAADIAVGGQGAPLVPPVDVCLLGHPSYDRCIQNIGGIGNVAYLPAKRHPAHRASATPGATPSAIPINLPPILGWDTGPGNALLDLAVMRLSGGQQTFDQDGRWAAQGTPCTALVDQWLQHDFFQQPPPKSTGRELFGHTYLEQCLADASAHALSEADFLATLTELTAASIAHSYQNFLPAMPDQVFLCGGGSHNGYLRQRIQAHLGTAIAVGTTDDLGINANYKEAIAFAVLAYWRCQGFPGNLPDVTGARQLALLGELHPVAGDRQGIYLPDVLQFDPLQFESLTQHEKD